ncbi:ACP S-malonyltransferase [Burkholderia gladioli]|uniref:ACP S-malonyltransferase n=1 Tax=Burkholderia gladioli TaxID=28095 RepID=UPI001641BB8B|nr:ACP S-malonyltransferase [Burkholderia gladioli]
MDVAYVFPGLGSQLQGMGAGLFDAFPDEVTQADAILGYSIRSLCVEDAQSVLARTEYAQPALYTVGVLDYLQRRNRGDAAGVRWLAGHSLGEYCALFAAGAFDFATGLRLLQRRGALMSSAPKGAMAAVIGMTAEAIRACLRESNLESIDLANINSGNQIILSGLYDEVRSRETAARFEQAGASYVLLNVGAAFHSRYMREVEREFHAFLGGVELRPLQVDVIANVTARPYPRRDYAGLLSSQISSPVRWYETVSWLLAQGCGEIEQIGPGTVLTKLSTAIKARPMVIEPDPAPAASIDRQPPAAPALSPVRQPRTQAGRRAVFMYGGQGTQYFQMGRQLYDEHPVFREHFDACSELAEPELGASLVRIVYDEARAPYDPFDAIGHTHPALFAIGHALTAVARAEGIEAEAVLGYSLGEYVALAAAGCLSWQDGLRLCLRQSRAIGQTSLDGGMLSVLAPLDHFDDHPESYADLELAGINFGENFCVAGPRASLERTRAQLNAAGILSLDLPVRFPFHSSHIDAMRDEILAVADGITLKAPVIPVYSPSHGRRIDERDLADPARFAWNVVRKRVDFHRLVRALAAEAPARAFLDLSATGSLANFIKYMSVGTGRAHTLINQFGKDIASLAALRDAFEATKDHEHAA